MNRIEIAVVFADAVERLNWTQALQSALADAAIEAQVRPWDPVNASRVDLKAPTQAPIKADYAVGWLPPAAFFTEQTQLKAFFNAGAGVDAILRAKTVPSDLAIYRLEDAGMGLQMAQYCVLECLHVLGQRSAYGEDQKSARWQPRAPLDASDFPVGIVGMGVLGQRVAASLQALGFPVQGYRRQNHEAKHWRDFLQSTRLLILLAPLTGQTRGMINAETLGLLMPGAWLINVARGPLVVESDLIDALDRNILAGASLDVFCEEPLNPSSRLWTHPSIRITPHIAACTLLQPAVKQIAAKMQQLMRGEQASGLIDRALAY